MLVAKNNFDIVAKNNFDIVANIKIRCFFQYDERPLFRRPLYFVDRAFHAGC